MKWKLSVAFFVMAIIMCCSINAEEPVRKENLQITRNLIPLDYTLLFEIDMEDKTNLFTGTATIKIRCVQRTKEIVLNAKNLEIDKNYVQVEKESVPQYIQCLEEDFSSGGCVFPEDGSSRKTIPLAIEDQGPEEESERYKIVLEEELKEDEVVTVLIKYRKLSYPDMAFIKYSYKKESNGEEKFLAVSRSGAIHARRLFPCVDERDLSISITVMISHHRNFKSVSNTNFEVDAEYNSVATDAELTDIVVDKYNTAQPMSTFSMGLVVGNLNSNDVADDSSVNEVRLWADESIIGQTTYAKGMATKILEYYQKYFEIKHPVHKVDIVALPNYGYTDKWMLDLITLDESVITNLYPREKIRKIEIAFQLCDVFSHQFFGPQTAIAKWSGNWLNMGLALFFRAPCFHNIFPTERKSLMIIDETESFIRISDADPRSIFHPLTLSDSQINLNTLFEDSALADIAYYLVRMLNSIISKFKEVLYESVKQYIADSRSKVFKSNEIWHLFDRGPVNYYMEMPLTLETIMDSWTSTNAIPVIELIRTDVREEMVLVTQQPLETDAQGNKIYKYVPLNYATKSDLLDPDYQRRVRLWVKDEPDKIKYVRNEDWIIHDSRLDVLCRYVYDESILNLIEETLSSESQYITIPVLARAQLISDMLAIAEMEEYQHYTYKTVLRILRYLKHERSLPPLMVALHEFNKIRLRLLHIGRDVFIYFQEYVQKIIQTIIEEKKYENIFEFEENDYTEYYLKKLIVASACTFEIEHCVIHSKKLFYKWRNAIPFGEFDGESKRNTPTNSYPESVRQYIYCQAIREGGREEWEYLRSFYDKKNAGKSDDILNALACTRDWIQLKMYLKWSINTGEIAMENSLTVFKSVGTTADERSYSLVYEFLHDNWKHILAAHRKNLSNVYSYWKFLYEITFKQSDFDKLESFTKSVASKVQNIETHLEESRKKAKKNIWWLKRKGRNIASFVMPWYPYDGSEIDVK